MLFVLNSDEGIKYEIFLFLDTQYKSAIFAIVYMSSCTLAKFIRENVSNVVLDK
jgi:hypothetical protein